MSDIHLYLPLRSDRSIKAVSRASRDAAEEWGVRYRMANRSGQISVKEKIFSTEAALRRFVKTLENSDGFIEIDSWLNPRKSRDAPASKEEIRKLEAESDRLSLLIKKARGEEQLSLRAKRAKIEKQIEQMSAVTYGINHPRPGDIKRLHGPRNPFARDAQIPTLVRNEYNACRQKAVAASKEIDRIVASGGRVTEADPLSITFARNSGRCGVLKRKYPGLSTTDGLRLIQTYTSGTNQVKVYKDDEWGEYRARLFFGGKLHEPADYHSDDKSDVLSTAQAMLRNAVKPKGWKDEDPKRLAYRAGHEAGKGKKPNLSRHYGAHASEYNKGYEVGKFGAEPTWMQKGKDAARFREGQRVWVAESRGSSKGGWGKIAGGPGEDGRYDIDLDNGGSLDGVRPSDIKTKAPSGDAQIQPGMPMVDALPRGIQPHQARELANRGRLSASELKELSIHYRLSVEQLRQAIEWAKKNSKASPAEEKAFKKSGGSRFN